MQEVLQLRFFFGVDRRWRRKGSGRSLAGEPKTEGAGTRRKSQGGAREAGIVAGEGGGSGGGEERGGSGWVRDTVRRNRRHC